MSCLNHQVLTESGSRHGKYNSSRTRTKATGNRANITPEGPALGTQHLASDSMMFDSFFGDKSYSISDCYVRHNGKRANRSIGKEGESQSAGEGNRTDVGIVY